MKKILILTILFGCLVSETFSQSNHDHSSMGSMMKPMKMSSAFSLNLPMNRNGSGTSWLPDSSAMYAQMFHSGNWIFMLHYNLFIRYNNQDFTNKGNRGGAKFDAPILS